MNHAFCRCGRDCEWPQTHTEALCRCSRVNEPMTPLEREEARQEHETRLQRIASRATRPPYFSLKGQQ